MKRILTSLVLVASVYSFAQVSISGEADDTPQATLDVKAIDGKTNGILVPRVSRKVADNMAKPAGKSGGIEGAIIESTLIYINDISMEEPTNYATNVKAPGFYYFKGEKWVSIAPGSSGAGAKVQAYDSASATLEDDADFVIYTPLKGASTLNLPDSSVDGRKICVFNNSGNGNLTTAPQAKGQNSVVYPNSGSCYVSYNKKWFGVGFY